MLLTKFTAYLVLRQKREMQKDLNGFRVGRHDHKLRHAAVQSLRRCEHTCYGVRGQGAAWRARATGSEPLAHMHAELRTGTFIGAFLQLLVIGSLLNDVEDGVRELRTKRRASAMLRFRRGSRRGLRVSTLTANSRTCESASG